MNEPVQGFAGLRPIGNPFGGSFLRSTRLTQGGASRVARVVLLD